MRSIKEIAANSLLTETKLKKIEQIIFSHADYTREAVRNEIAWFCTKLGMPPYYFKTTLLETIAVHIEALKSAEVMANIRKEKDLLIDLVTESKNEALYLIDDNHQRAIELERRIEAKYPNSRIQSYRTVGKTLGRKHLRLYVVNKPKFSTRKILHKKTNLKEIACKDFLKNTTKKTYLRYQSIIEKAKGWETPLIEASEKAETAEFRIMVVTNRDSSYSFFSNISDVINSYKLVSNRKYIEQFANGKTVYAIYLEDIKNKSMLKNMIEDITLVYVVPESPLSQLFRTGKLNAQETVFGVSAWSFSHQFLSAYNEEYLKLADVLKESPELLGVLRNLKTKLAKDTYTESKVWDAFFSNHKYIKKLFKVFDRKFNPALRKHSIDKILVELEDEINRKIPSEIDRNIFAMVIVFIRSIQRTNFYKKEKNSIAFMYDSSFLNRIDYPEPPFGVFQIIAIEFRGFHIRFRDIARGGVRLVRSHNFQTYINNSDCIFDENYNLALTQQKKNKDIPEGGSKGTILLGIEYQDKAETAFKKYINGLLDLLVLEKDILDYYGKEVLLFLGPDEGTADLMEWTSLRAKKLGYQYWKAFSTGKPIKRGGIPHDLYGMTTNSVHRYVINILKQLKLKEDNMTKVMTGGPDGDLGSNEILISKDKIMAMIDGSGVLYDPRGLNRKELDRLARKRKMITHFSKELLSKNGFLVNIKNSDITLPDGEYVTNGLEFRNSFHLNEKFKADIFVPCGGRPASISINNWKDFLDKEGNPRFKIISEGANLFITQGARLRLEESGVYIYKDASANKGGVTSSSLEVFACLALSDEEFVHNMCVKGNNVPVFRKNYIDEILEIIRKNADQEFLLIEKEKKKTGLPRAVLTDRISEKINNVTDAVYSSKLFKDGELFRNTVKNCCSKVLMQLIGFENLMQRVPEVYIKAIFASDLASSYVYSFGLDADEIDFYEYVKKIS